jgi:hypothetical protein
MTLVKLTQPFVALSSYVSLTNVTDGTRTVSPSPADALKRRARQKQSELSMCEDPARRFELLRERNVLLAQARAVADTQHHAADPPPHRDGPARHRSRSRPRHPGLQLAIERCGGVRALAERLALPVRSVASWRRVPADHVEAIARSAGLSADMLRAELSPAVPLPLDAVARQP